MRAFPSNGYRLPYAICHMQFNAVQECHLYYYQRHSYQKLLFYTLIVIIIFESLFRSYSASRTSNTYAIKPYEKWIDFNLQCGIVTRWLHVSLQSIIHFHCIQHSTQWTITNKVPLKCSKIKRKLLFENLCFMFGADE